MSMFDDLDADFEPTSDDALEAVARRMLTLRTRRRLVFGGAAASLVLVTALSSVAFAAGSQPRRVAVTSPDSSTTTVANDAPPASTVPDTASVTTTPAVPATVPSTRPRSQTPNEPTGDVSAVEVSLSTNALDIVQGDSADVTVTLHNTATAPVTLGPDFCALPTRVYIAGNDCIGGPENITLAPDETRVQTVSVYASSIVAFSGSHPPGGILGAVGPGDYDVRVTTFHDTTVHVHVRGAISETVNPNPITVHAGDRVDLTLHVHNDAHAPGTYEIPVSVCVGSGVVCAAGALVARVPALGDASPTVPLAVGAETAPGAYTLAVGTVNVQVIVVAPAP
jgi:hypothetical protein